MNDKRLFWLTFWVAVVCAIGLITFMNLWVGARERADLFEGILGSDYIGVDIDGDGVPDTQLCPAVVDTVLLVDTIYQSLSYPVPIWTMNQYGQPMGGVFISFYDNNGERRVAIVTNRWGQAYPYLPLGKWRIGAVVGGRLFGDTTIIVKQSANPVVLIGIQIDGGIH